MLEAKRQQHMGHDRTGNLHFVLSSWDHHTQSNDAKVPTEVNVHPHVAAEAAAFVALSTPDHIIDLLLHYFYFARSENGLLSYFILI